MTTRWIIALLASMIGTAFAVAEEPVPAQVPAQTWSLGGAALAVSDASRTTLWTDKDGMSVGVGAANGSLSQSSASGGMQTGGFLAWQSSIYRFDATMSPSSGGQMTGAIGASVGPEAGETGTRYGLRIGTAWTPDRFTVNPAASMGFGEYGVPYSNVNVSFLINHALTPNLNLIGLAEAQHFGISALDGTTGLGRLVVGAGLGYKF
jgi:hypothetical protein